jgi:peptidoglycan/LPS O-acetylase OafA/YrhL
LRRFPAVDALRFVFAFWVVVHHAETPPEKWIIDHEVLWRSFWFGPAAVIGFFVISGFVIHAPYVNAERIDWWSYFTRRYIRIGVPLAAIFAVGAWTNVDYNPWHGAVTWSLVCELVYYTAYPAIRYARSHIGLPALIAASYVVGYASVWLWAEHPTSETITMLRSVLSNLPVWLLGCLIAEAVVNGRAALITTTPGIWLARAVAAATTTGIGWLQYRNFVSAYWLMPAIALIAAPWLWAEFVRTATAVTAWAGSWSYSLYLVHVAAFAYYAKHFENFRLDLYHNVHRYAAWGSTICFALLVAYGYYLLVERPAHRAARRISRFAGRGEGGATKSPPPTQRADGGPSSA